MSDIQDSDWATHTEELTRKTAGVLGRWSKLYDAGKLSKREYFIILTVIYDTTSGLIARDLMRLIERLDAELRREMKSK